MQNTLNPRLEASWSAHTPTEDEAPQIRNPSWVVTGLGLEGRGIERQVNSATATVAIPIGKTAPCSNDLFIISQTHTQKTSKTKIKFCFMK